MRGRTTVLYSFSTIPFLSLFYISHILTHPGPSLEWIKKLYNYWLKEFKWEKAQEQISGWKHYVTDIEGLKIHFVHEKAKVGAKGEGEGDNGGRQAVPLLMVHGWPGTWFEYVFPFSMRHGAQTKWLTSPGSRMS
jgi:hypothetical protein